MNIEIESGIPIPEKKTTKYPWKAMEVGQSFFIKTDGSRKQYVRIACSATSAAYRQGKKFAVRNVEGGVRVWRAE